MGKSWTLKRYSSIQKLRLTFKLIVTTVLFVLALLTSRLMVITLCFVYYLFYTTSYLPQQRTLVCSKKLFVIVGAFGVDFSAPDEDINEGLPRVAKGILSHGVTSFCPTVITSPSDVYHKLLPHFYRQPGSPKGAGILGNNWNGLIILLYTSCRGRTLVNV